jgi:hypothetical protein
MTQPYGGPPGAAAPKKPNPAVWILAGCATIVVLGGIAGIAAVWWGYNRAKSYAEETLQPGSGPMTSVAQLWSDVPPMEGMAQSHETQMPLALKAIMRPFLDGVMRGLNNGKEAGHWDVAYFMLSGKTTRDVEAFYVPARMSQYGWKQQGGCANVVQATFCSFQKQEGVKGTGLLVIATDDQEHKSTVLYFIRGENQEQ